MSVNWMSAVYTIYCCTVASPRHRWLGDAMQYKIEIVQQTDVLLSNLFGVLALR